MTNPEIIKTVLSTQYYRTTDQRVWIPYLPLQPSMLPDQDAFTTPPISGAVNSSDEPARQPELREMRAPSTRTRSTPHAILASVRNNIFR